MTTESKKLFGRFMERFPDATEEIFCLAVTNRLAGTGHANEDPRNLTSEITGQLAEFFDHISAEDLMEWMYHLAKKAE